MMSDFRGDEWSKMTPKNWIIGGKNRIKGEEGSKMTEKIGHHLCMIPNCNWEFGVDCSWIP